MLLQRETLSAKFTSCFTKYYEDEHLILVAVLDPRFKTEWIMRDSNIWARLHEIRETVIEQIGAMGIALSGRTEPTRKKQSLMFPSNNQQELLWQK